MVKTRQRKVELWEHKETKEKIRIQVGRKGSAVSLNQKLKRLKTVNREFLSNNLN